MNQDELLQEVIKRIKRSDFFYQIQDFLKSQGVTGNQSEELIELAQQKILDEKLEYLPRRNKILFGIFSFIAIASFIFFLFILPTFQIQSNSLFALLGTIIFTFFAFLSFAYYQSWEREVIEIKLKNDKGIDFGFLILFSVPAVIIYFLFSWRLSSGEDTRLKNTQVEAVGTIVSGSSLTSRMMDLTQVTVEFETADGKKINVNENISEYEFKGFYKGQKVNLIYSSENPHNIELLVKASDIRKYKNSEERKILPQDLIDLIEIDKENVLQHLNKITFGWQMDGAENSWTNESKNFIFSKNNNEVSFLTSEFILFTYKKYFTRLGFTQTSEDDKILQMQKERTFDSENYSAIVRREYVLSNIPFYLVTITKKN